MREWKVRVRHELCFLVQVYLLATKRMQGQKFADTPKEVLEAHLGLLVFYLIPSLYRCQ